MQVQSRASVDRRALSPLLPPVQGNPECQHRAPGTAEGYAMTLACGPMQISVATEPTLAPNTLSVES